jgi:hypothetical protein
MSSKSSAARRRTARRARVMNRPYARGWVRERYRGVMTEQDPDQPAEEFHRNRREHPGKLERLDDDQLARLTEEERVEAGLDDYDPDEVPPATDEPPEFDVTQGEEYQEARAEIRRQDDKGELEVEGERPGFPPTRYDQ